MEEETDGAMETETEGDDGGREKRRKTKAATFRQKTKTIALEA